MHPPFFQGHLIRTSFVLIAMLTSICSAPRAWAQVCDAGSCPAVKVYGEGEDARCRAWATEAIGQQLENEQLKCGFAGADWHYDIKLHFRICGGLRQLDRDQFAASRRDKLKSCRERPAGDAEPDKADTETEAKIKATPEWDEYCRKSYMVDALKIARTANDWKCTDADPELHLSQQRHYDFCIREAPKGAGDYPLHDLIGDRQEKIQQCQQKQAVKKPIDREVRVRRRACSKFADIFLNAHLENARLKCGNSGDDWHNNWNLHYRNCSELDRSERLTLIHNRQTEMTDCRSKIFPKEQHETDDSADSDAKVSPDDATDDVRAACETYAKDAVAHQAANQQLNCGFSGPLWDISDKTHFETCIVSRADYAFRSNLARDAKLRQCTSARLCQNPTRARTLYCQDLTGLVPPEQDND